MSLLDINNSGVALSVKSNDKNALGEKQITHLRPQLQRSHSQISH
ncbi:hypothetical protein [Calothrix sp. NIES-2098]|nr:hypothetical protein NIES2098_28310 [Calothrix sp. NIES-2098]